MDRDSVYKAIDTERVYQDKKWGDTSQHPHEVGAYLVLMEVHLQQAKVAWAGSAGDAGALEQLRKVLAIGVACSEQHGIPNRSPWSPPENMRAVAYQAGN